MWPVPVVLIDEDFKNSLKVRLVQDQQPIEALRTGCAHESLGNPIRLWRAKRRTNDLNVVTSEHVVKTRGEFLIPIANQESDGFRALRQGPRQLPGLLNDPRLARIGRATGQMDAPAAQFDEEQDIESLQPDRLDREEIDGQQALPMCPHELSPRRPPALPRWSETRGPKPTA